jgi:Protein of unknown function (DUF1194)
MQFLQALTAVVLATEGGLWSSSAAGGDMPVDLELVLAVDVSASMTGDEEELQRKGYVAAFRSPRVLNAIRSGPTGRIAVTFVEWADAGKQDVIVPWTLVEDAGSAGRFADALQAKPLQRMFGTSIAGALLFAAALFEKNDFAGERKAIDISGNGPNNLGLPVEQARDTVVDKGVTINGLPVMIRTRWSAGLYSIAGLDFYFDDCVIGGPGAFTVVIREEDEFATAIERKLVLEISSLARTIPVAAVERPHHMDCLAGEKGVNLLPLR